MRIQRQQSHLTFRRRQRRGGCLPLVAVAGIMALVALLVREFGDISLPVLQQPVNLQRGVAAFGSGDLDQAIEVAESIYEGNLTNTPALTLLVRALIYRSYADYDRSSDRKSALELTTEAMGRNPGNTEVMGLHAWTLQVNDLSDEASRLALRVIERSPTNLPARLALSLAYGRQGIFEAALREAKRAVELADTTASDWGMDARRVLAIAYSDLGRYDEAIKAVRAAIDLHKTLAPLYFERALYALQIGDNDAATAAYFSVLSFDDENVKARLRLCELSSTMRERTAAVQYCNEVTQRAPGWSDGWYYLGREYFLQGDFKGAQDALHRCSTLQVLQEVPVEQRRFECWYIQGQAAEIVGDCEALLSTYNEFRTMSAGQNLTQTWVYPPEGPPGCTPEVTVAASS
jgi:tetratricopeptide (TPR) repeat protein